MKKRTQCGFQLVKELVFDKPAEVKKAAKTSRPPSSAYKGTVEGGLCGKSKTLETQGLLTSWKKIDPYFHCAPSNERSISKDSVLTVCSFLAR